MGDLSHLFPVVNFYLRGFAGQLHSPDFAITDEKKAFLLPAKLLALTAYRLLRDNAREARQVMERFEPVFDRGRLLRVYSSHYER